MALPPRRFLVAACVAGVLGAGAAGIASAQLAHNRSKQPTLTAATARVQPNWHRPTRRPTTPPTTTPTPISNAPTTIAPTTIAPTTIAPTTNAPTTNAPTTGAPTTQAPTPTPTPNVPSSVIDQVLAHINAARAQNGLAALALSTNLSKASALHNQLMINGCGLSHQCPGEASLGDRFTAQGVPWTSAGENIGYGSAGSSTAAIVGAANGLTDSMLAEVPPNDGHRRNLLNPGFKHIGLAVERDSKGLVWMTQDFVN